MMWLHGGTFILRVCARASKALQASATAAADAEPTHFEDKCKTSLPKSSYMYRSFAFTAPVSTWDSKRTQFKPPACSIHDRQVVTNGAISSECTPSLVTLATTMDAESRSNFCETKAATVSMPETWASIVRMGSKMQPGNSVSSKATCDLIEGHLPVSQRSCSGRSKDAAGTLMSNCQGH